MNTIEVLQSKGLRPTTNRIAILEILTASNFPLSRQELLKHPSLIKLHPITVYRALGVLEDSVIIHKITLDDRSWKYFIANERNERLAIVECVQCGNIDKVSLQYRALENVLPWRFRLLEANVQLKGICKDCSS